MGASDIMAVSPPEIDMRLIAVPDAKPEFLYVLSTTRGVARQEAMHRTREALGAGLVHYRRRRGMSITDRDGQNYEIAYFNSTGRSSFGSLAGRFHSSTGCGDCQPSHRIAITPS